LPTIQAATCIGVNWRKAAALTLLLTGGTDAAAAGAVDADADATKALTDDVLFAAVFATVLPNAAAAAAIGGGKAKTGGGKTETGGGGFFNGSDGGWPAFEAANNVAPRAVKYMRGERLRPRFSCRRPRFGLRLRLRLRLRRSFRLRRLRRLFRSGLRLQLPLRLPLRLRRRRSDRVRLDDRDLDRSWLFSSNAAATISSRNRL
jgi:hypothetical protein